jgi:hypothetical protein
MESIYALKKDFKNLKQAVSEDRKNFKEVHIYIINKKVWLREIHHHCGKEGIQNYQDKYYFRYKTRSKMDIIFDLLIKKTVTYKEISIK